MNLSEDISIQISKWAVTITLLSTLIGAHLTASYLLYEFELTAIDFIAKILLGLVLLNGAYFLCCIGFVITNIPKKSMLLKSTLLMLINIPVAIACLLVVLFNEFQ